MRGEDAPGFVVWRKDTLSTRELRSTSTPLPANRTFDSPSMRSARCWEEPPKSGQEQAQARSGSKATRPKTSRATERGPLGSRVETMIGHFALFTQRLGRELHGTSHRGDPRSSLPVVTPAKGGFELLAVSRHLIYCDGDKKPLKGADECQQGGCSMTPISSGQPRTASRPASEYC